MFADRFARPLRPPSARTTSRAAMLTALAGLLVAPSAAAGPLETIASFDGANGASPYAGLAFDAAGNLYGTTSGGGAGGYGTVFEIAAGSGTLTTLASFNSTNGSDPRAGLVLDAAGNLYGTTYYGGAGGYGTVFEIARGSGTLTTLASFNYNNGANPYSGLTFDAAGNLYGTTSNGGAHGEGTVFELARGSGTPTTLVSFNGTNGSSPEAGLTADAAGNLYGTTFGGGAGGYGTVFKVAAGSGTLTTLASFSSYDGAYPQGRLIRDAAGNLYGTTYNGGGPGYYGTVFEIAAGSSTITNLASFDRSNGADPLAGLTADAAGNLYGTTSFAGPGGHGTVFELAAGSGTLTTLASFDGTNGSSPLSDLTFDAAGNLYGTTAFGGAHGEGTVFELAGIARIPEPSSLLLLGIGAAAIAARAIRRRRAPDQ